MARLLVRSSRVFMTGALSALNKDTDTPFASVRDAITSDPEEFEPVRKVLKVLVMQQHISQTGEGDTASYRLTNSGEQLLSLMKGE